MQTVLSPIDLWQIAHFLSSVILTFAFFVLIKLHFTFCKSISLNYFPTLICLRICSDEEILYCRKLHKPSSALLSAALLASTLEYSTNFQLSGISFRTSNASSYEWVPYFFKKILILVSKSTRISSSWL